MPIILRKKALVNFFKECRDEEEPFSKLVLCAGNIE